MRSYRQTDKADRQKGRDTERDGGVQRRRGGGAK